MEVIGNTVDVVRVLESRLQLTSDTTEKELILNILEYYYKNASKLGRKRLIKSKV